VKLAVLFAGLWVALLPAAMARDVDSIRNSGQLIVCAGNNALPISDDGDKPGFMLEIAREIARELGVRTSVEWIWASYQAKFTDCDFMLGVARDPKPGGFARYLQALVDVEIILVFADDPETIMAEGLEGKVIAAPSGSLAHFALLEEGADLRVAYKSDVAILEAIAGGDLDAGVVTSVALNWHSNENNGVDFFSVSTDILGVPHRYPMSIGLRHADSLDEADLHEIVERLRDDGLLQGILARYGQTLSVDFDDPYARVPQEASEPLGVSVRKDVIKKLEERVRRYKESNTNLENK